MTTFAVTSSDQTLDAINYLLSNLGQTGNVGNVTIPTGTLIGNTTTGLVSTYNYGGGVPYSYLYQYLNLRYANNATGTSGFSTVPTNSDYFGVYNSITSTASSVPAAYTWFQVAGGFGTTKFIFYSTQGGRQVQLVPANVAPSSSFIQSTANVAIDLDIVTTAAGTPGERGPIAMAYVVTPSTPVGASDLQLTLWWEAARDSLTPPIGTGLTPVVGDTGTFIYGAGVGTPSVTYEYNGSGWTSVVQQVISGNVLVANSTPGTAITPASITGNRIANATLTGNLIVSSTITGNLIVPATLTGNLIAGNTITANNIAANTITASQIAANTITANNILTGTITSNQIAANTITANNILTGTITANNIATGTITASQIAANTITSNQIAANTITSNNIQTGTITANNIATGTITANNIATGTITASQIAANTITSNQIAANTITASQIATGTITSNRIAANTITANNISTSYLYTGNIVSNTATLGSNTSSGYWLRYTDGAARFGGSVSIGNNASIGNNVSIGGNLTIGSNLSVTGLVTAGTLIANTVQTETVVAASISTNASTTRNSNVVIGVQVNNSSPTIGYTLAGPVAIAASVGFSIYISGGCQLNATWTNGNPSQCFQYQLMRNTPQSPPGSYETVYTYLSDTYPPAIARDFSVISWVESNIQTAGTYTYLWTVRAVVVSGSSTRTTTMSSSYGALIGQVLKR